MATLRKCSNREAREGIPISGEKLECVSPKTFVWRLQTGDMHVIWGKQMHLLLFVHCLPSECFVVAIETELSRGAPFHRSYVL